MSIPNDSSTGTTTNLLAKINTSGNAITASHTTDLALPVYVCSAGCGTTASATLNFGGTVTCQADATGITRGHFVQLSSATDGRCADGGSTAPTSNWVIGIAQTAAAANATFTLALNQGYNATAGGGGSPAGSSGQLQYNNGGSFGGVGSYTMPNLSTTTATVTSLPTSGWSIFNSALLDDFSIGHTAVFIPQNATLNLRGITRSISVPYTLIAQIDCQYSSAGSGTQDCGLLISDGTKYEAIDIEQAANVHSGVRVLCYTNVNTVSVVAGPTSNTIGKLIAFKIANNGTTRTLTYWSNGAWASAVVSEAAGTCLTETTAGIGGFSGSGAPDDLEARLKFWQVQ